MPHDKMNANRLVGLFLLGWLVFNFPLLSLFNRPILVMGIPVLYLYLFASWSSLIALMLMLSRRRTSPPQPETDR